MRPYKIVTTGLPPKEVYYLRGPAFEDEDSEPAYLDHDYAAEACRLCNDVHEAATKAPSRGSDTDDNRGN